MHTYWSNSLQGAFSVSAQKQKQLFCSKIDFIFVSQGSEQSIFAFKIVMCIFLPLIVFIVFIKQMFFSNSFLLKHKTSNKWFLKMKWNWTLFVCDCLIRIVLLYHIKQIETYHDQITTIRKISFLLMILLFHFFRMIFIMIFIANKVLVGSLSERQIGSSWHCFEQKIIIEYVEHRIGQISNMLNIEKQKCRISKIKDEKTSTKPILCQKTKIKLNLNWSFSC